MKPKTYKVKVGCLFTTEVELKNDGSIVAMKCEYNNRGEYEWVELPRLQHPIYRWLLVEAQLQVNYLIDVGTIKLKS